MPILRRRPSENFLRAVEPEAEETRPNAYRFVPEEESGQHVIARPQQPQQQPQQRHETKQMWAPRRAGANEHPSTLPLMNAVTRAQLAAAAAAPIPPIPAPPQVPSMMPSRPSMGDGELNLPVLHPSPKKKPTPVVAAPQQQQQPSKPAAEPPRFNTVKMQAVKSDKSPPSSGRMFDENDFLDTDPGLSLDLDVLPQGQAASQPQQTMAGPPTKPSAVIHFAEGSSAGGAPPASSPTHAEPKTSEHSVVRKISSATLAAIAASSDGDANEVQPPASRRSSGGGASAAVAVGASPVIDPKRAGLFAFAGFGLVPEKLKDTPAYAVRVLSRRQVLRRDLETARRHRASDVELYEAALQSADADAVRKGLTLIIAVIAIALAAFGFAVSAIL